MLETRGLATVTIGLVRPHLEAVKPPRSVFTPFQLGRPLGEPNDPAFQRRVLMQALALLERRDGPVILEDFPDDAPGAGDQSGWRPPLVTQADDPATPEAWAAALAQEMAELRPMWEQAREQRHGTTVGVSVQPPEAWPDFMAAFLAGGLPDVPAHATPALALRFLLDDLKAYYGEAAQARGPVPSSGQIDRWLWRQTIAGRFMIALREVCLRADNNALRTVAGRFFVPRPYLPG